MDYVWIIVLLLTAINLFNVYRNQKLPHLIQAMLVKKLYPHIHTARLAIEAGDKEAALVALKEIETYVTK